LAIRSTSFDVNMLLRIHYSLETCDKLDSLIDKLNCVFGGDDRFKVFFKAIERLGGPNDHALQVADGTDKSSIAMTLAAKLSKDTGTFFLDNQYVCYASKANSLVIRSNGDIAKCTVALNDPRNTIGRLNEDGTLTINRDALVPWLRGLESLDAQVLACPYK